MRSLPIIGLWAAAVMLWPAGCGRNESALVNTSEVKSPARWWVESASRFGSARADVRRKRADVEAARKISGEEPTVALSHTKPGKTSREIARRIADTLEEWESYQGELSAEPQRQIRNGEYPPNGRTKVAAIARIEDEAEQADPQSVMAARRRHSAEYLNWQIRVALLESRLAAAGESEGRILSGKLEQARAALKAVDEACQAEAKNRPGSPEGTTSGPSDGAYSMGDTLRMSR